MPASRAAQGRALQEPRWNEHRTEDARRQATAISDGERSFIVFPRSELVPHLSSDEQVSKATTQRHWASRCSPAPSSNGGRFSASGDAHNDLRLRDTDALALHCRTPRGNHGRPRRWPAAGRNGMHSKLTVPWAAVWERSSLPQLGQPQARPEHWPLLLM